MMDETLSTDRETDSEFDTSDNADKTLSTDSEESDDDEMVQSAEASTIPQPEDESFDVNEPSTSTPRRSPRKKRFMFLPSPTNLITSDCCTNQCTKNLTYREIENAQADFRAATESDIKKEVFRQIAQHTKITQVAESTVEAEFNFVLRGKYVCPEAWKLAFNVNEGKFRNCVKRLKDGHTSVDHGNAGTKRLTLKTGQAEGWLEKKIERIGDHMPDSNKIKLPQTMTKKRLYEEMKTNFLERGTPETEIVSYAYFTKLWARKFPNVSISDGSTFTTCSECQVIKDLIAKAKTDCEAESAKKVLEQHEMMVEAERGAYHTAREEAAQGDDRLTTIIIDGMDQAKTNLPHIIPRDKKLEPLARLPTHVTGCIIHCNLPGSKVPLVFIDHKHIPHDPNLTINVLIRALHMYERHLGRKLFLQLDNCFRENKNRFFLSFASLLVQYEIFQEVTVHFLPVGHTHEDIDQMFSRISVKLSRNMAYTLPDFITLVEDSYTPRIKLYEACPIFDVKEWMIPHMEDTMTGHSKPLWFRFRQASGAVRMQWRKFVSSPWMPLPEYEEDGSTLKEESYGYVCMKTIPDITEVPNYVKPSLDRVDKTGLLRDLPKNYSDRLPQIAQEWWQQYLQNIDNLEKVPPKPTSWQLTILSGHAQQVDDEEVHLPTPVQRIQEGLAEITPQVIIGRQGRSTAAAARVQTVDNYSGIKEGVMVAVNLDDDTPPPYIGKVVERSGDEIEIEWYRGNYNRKWVPWMAGAGRNYRNIPTTKCHVSCCLLWDFALTQQGQKLPGIVIDQLRKKYDEIGK